MTTYVKPWENWNSDDFEKYSNLFLQKSKCIDEAAFEAEYQRSENNIQLAKKYDDIFDENFDDIMSDTILLKQEQKKYFQYYLNFEESTFVLYGSTMKGGDKLSLTIKDVESNETFKKLISSNVYELLYFIIENENYIQSVDLGSFETISDYLYI